MEPEFGGPYWAIIVGEHWPRIGPGEWSGLETAARDGAAALDLTGVESARRGFDERVRASHSLQAVKDDMLAQGHRLHELQAMLAAAGDAFHDFAAVVGRTRNRILDIVDDALTQIGRLETEHEQAGLATPPGEIIRILEVAAQEVAAVAADARTAISFERVPGLVTIAELLGLPFPWRGGADAGPGRPGGGNGRPGEGGHHRGTTKTPVGKDAGQPGQGKPGNGFPNSAVTAAGSQPGGPTSLGGLPGGALPADLLPGSLGLGLGDGVADPATGDGNAALPSGGIGGGSGTNPAGGRFDSPLMSAPVPVSGPGGSGTPHDGGSPVYLPPTSQSGPSGYDGGPAGAPSGVDGGSESGAVSPDSSGPSGPSGPGPGQDGATPPGSESATGDDGFAVGSTQATRPLNDSPQTDAEPGRDTEGSAEDRFGSPGVVPMVFGPPMDLAVSGPLASPAATQTTPPQSVSSASGTDMRGATAASAQDPRGVSSVSAPVHSPPPGAVSAPGKAAVGARPGDPSHLARPPANDGAAELIKDVVGAAMAAAAVPGIVSGGGVDGDLVLARTLLGNVLAVVEDSPLAPDWAVAVLRHSSGVSVFLTSNEGRGWLPAGLYLPREVSIPWVWEAAQGPPWEGVSDPARVLVEFGLLWGRDTGARVSAVAASRGIDASLRELRDVAWAQEVPASAGMDFATPRPGLIDRLEVVSTQRLLARVAEVPVELIGRRCVDLAWDAHVRTGKTAGATENFGAVGARTRIIKARRADRAVSPDWWDELRDADDLLAATAVAHRLDVGAVPVGQLRAESRGSAGEAAALRAMLFQRRCNELVRLLAAEPTRQVLRDAVYVHGQLADHPAMTEATGPIAGARPPTVSVGPRTPNSR